MDNTTTAIVWSAESDKYYIRRAFGILQSTIRILNTRNGWYNKPRTEGESVALIHTEVSELFEFIRNRDDNGVKVPSDHISCDGETEELADIIIRVFDHVERHGASDLATAVIEKLEYNSRRGYRYGGKQV